MVLTTQPTLPSHLAAVDLGSNSFHLAIARVVGHEISVIDRVAERVQLAAGLGPDERLDDATIERALACIDRFAQRLGATPAAAVRVVGTDALRVAKNSAAFTEPAAVRLGHAIEIISGDEEARLIYRGVAQATPDEQGARQLVIDIGGGSTEVIVGTGLDVEVATSLHMGSISVTRQFFGDGVITRERFKRAQIAAQLNYERLDDAYRRGDWARTFGSSGTMIALEEILRENGWSAGGITKDGLGRFRDAIVAAGHVDRLDNIRGLKPQRAPIIAGGLAIARAAFKALPLKALTPTSAALREGVLYDLLARFMSSDVRETTIQQLQARFHADRAQAARVEETALRLFDSARWVEGKPDEIARARRWLAWAARLHEIGLAVSFHGYQKHGAYLIANSALPGFSRDESKLLAALVLAHRKRIGRDQLQDLPPQLREAVFRLAVLLRLAVRLERSPTERAPSAIALAVNGRALTLELPAGFLAQSPLTQVNLDDEVARLAEAGLALTPRSA